jgi:hypothetical protein
LNDFLDFVEREGDEYIFNTVTLISQSIYSVLSEDYGKYVTSMLLQTINKITAVSYLLDIKKINFLKLYSRRKVHGKSMIG